MSATNIKLAIAAVAACLLVFAGWYFRGLLEDSRDLAELQGAQAAIEASMARESSIASALETRLADLKANERVIEREKIKVVDRPVYRADCLDADGVRLVNAAKDGAAKPVAAVPATR